jgi:hypothetical protein
VGVFSALQAISGISSLALGLALLCPATTHADPSPATPLVAAAKVRGELSFIPGKTKAKKAEPKAFQSFSATMPSETIAGFRMGGAPEVEFVFGDIDIYKGHIDSFKSTHAQMSAERVLFAEASHAAQQTLAARKKRGPCPADAVALDYARASQAGVNFRQLGSKFEGTYFAIRQLDTLGESSGLTPDYRHQVKKSRSQYLQALTDLREMRAVFKGQLEAGLRARGCKSQKLLALANQLQQEAETKAAAAKKEAESKSAKTDAANATPVIRASTATFFVDNKGCSDTLNVHVDGMLLGQVAPGTKAAFQSLMGRHSLCLLGEGGKAKCGETGTLRNAFVYDGWSVTRHCESNKK